MLVTSLLLCCWRSLQVARKFLFPLSLVKNLPLGLPVRDEIIQFGPEVNPLAYRHTPQNRLSTELVRRSPVRVHCKFPDHLRGSC
ncbi:hypothetical protein DSM82_11420 [Salmonella enterica subsp. enterica serovar Telelkebir]|nr:hypothetical protein [Salmonella enterica subsp. enterica serovar Telelkebir]EBS3086701.1 hypothetical protein [Salmonella enterica subsp. enterica serovar Telelkebir]